MGGASTATPLFQNQLHSSNDMRLNQHSMQSVMKPSMGMSMEGQISQHDNVDRRMKTNHQMSNMRDMYRDNHDMTSNMMGQENSSNTRDMHKQDQAIGFTGPNQYFVKDNFGNYVYSYNDQQSEKSEEGNNQFIKGQYAYIMSNGVKRKVEYIANDNGFHIIKDNADPARIKRSSEPDLLQTKMTSVMDSSSMRNDGHDMYRLSTMRGRDMSSQMDRNMMGKDMTGRNMLGQDSMVPNMMGRNVYSIMLNRGMASDMSNRMKQQMDSNNMGHDMTMDVMGRNRFNQARNTQMMGGNIMMGRQDMTPNMMYNNIMDQGMMDMTNSQMSSNIMGGRGMMG